MKKVIVVEACLVCPYRMKKGDKIRDGYVCSEANRSITVNTLVGESERENIPNFPEGFPEWCPLLDYTPSKNTQP